MKKILLATALVVLALIALLGIWGLALPREHSVASRITVPAPPDSVYAVMRDFAGLPAWWKDVESITPVRRNDDAERWTEKNNGFEMTIIVSEEEPPLRMVTVIDTTGGAAFGGWWTHA